MERKIDPMARFVELHISVSGSPIAINPDTVSRIGMLKESTFVRFVDGQSVEVSETYAVVGVLLGGLSNATKQA